MVDLLKGELTGYRKPSAWDGSAPTAGDVVCKATVQGQVADGGRGALVLGSPNTPTGVLYEVGVEVSAYHDKKTRRDAFRSIEEAISYPEDLPATLTSEELHVESAEFDQPWRKDIEDPHLVRTFSLTLQAGHAC